MPQACRTTDSYSTINSSSFPAQVGQHARYAAPPAARPVHCCGWLCCCARSRHRLRGRLECSRRGVHSHRGRGGLRRRRRRRSLRSMQDAELLEVRHRQEERQPRRVVGLARQDVQQLRSLLLLLCLLPGRLARRPLCALGAWVRCVEGVAWRGRRHAPPGAQPRARAPASQRMRPRRPRQPGCSGLGRCAACCKGRQRCRGGAHRGRRTGRETPPAASSSAGRQFGAGARAAQSQQGGPALVCPPPRRGRRRRCAPSPLPQPQPPRRCRCSRGHRHRHRKRRRRSSTRAVLQRASLAWRPRQPPPTPSLTLRTRSSPHRCWPHAQVQQRAQPA